MPKIILLTLLYSLAILTGGGSAYAQKPPQDNQLVTQIPEVAPKPEIPNKVSTIMLEENRLSVEFVNLSLGEIMQAIARKAGFRVEGTSSALSRKVTTKFNDLDIDSGIKRLFSLVKESNYLINYDTKGSISKITVYNTVDKAGVVGSIGAGGRTGVSSRTGAVGRTGIVGTTGAAGSTPSAAALSGETDAVPLRVRRVRRIIPKRHDAPSPPLPAPQASQPETPEQEDNNPPAEN